MRVSTWKREGVRKKWFVPTFRDKIFFGPFSCTFRKIFKLNAGAKSPKKWTNLGTSLSISSLRKISKTFGTTFYQPPTIQIHSKLFESPGAMYFLKITWELPYLIYLFPQDYHLHVVKILIFDPTGEMIQVDLPTGLKPQLEICPFVIVWWLYSYTVIPLSPVPFLTGMGSLGQPRLAWVKPCNWRRGWPNCDDVFGDESWWVRYKLDTPSRSYLTGFEWYMVLVVSKTFTFSRWRTISYWNTEVIFHFLSCRQGLEHLRYPWTSYDVEDSYNIIDEKILCLLNILISNTWWQSKGHFFGVLLSHWGWGAASFFLQPTCGNM